MTSTSQRSQLRWLTAILLAVFSATSAAAQTSAGTGSQDPAHSRGGVLTLPRALEIRLFANALPKLLRDAFVPFVALERVAVRYRANVVKSDTV